MTHQPGYRGAQPPKVPLRPRQDGNAPKQDRSTAAKIVGWLSVLVLACAGAAAAAWLLVLLCDLAHDQWWPAVPVMSFGVAVQLVLVVFAGGLVQKFLAELMRYALGKRRLPKDDE